ncbi:hypothetical protein PGT21_033708 [Puccinia graminis f. sp. tritici]|uniref:HAT C-terminal dimerisation domain-containing protein n=1 Tax=Puccinia graminis f. sp. tritici TaxID=56615 RepID=A0A5B0MXR8_PUCGR|nr:hypothetical protein PGT21_033708 [Puccinia graminis f. sp. tritici]
MMLFNSRFKTHVPQITKLIQKVFNTREAEIDSLQPESPPRKQDQLPSRSTSESDSGGEEFNFYPANPEAERINTEIQRYNDGLFPMDKKGCVLGWWKAHFQDFPILASLARDYLACAASSATVERTFLAAAQVCDSGRLAMAIRTIERCISSHMWIRNGVRLDGIFSDCQQVIDDTRKNPNGQQLRYRLL